MTEATANDNCGTEKPLTLPGVDYLGKGYDGFKGNPRPTGEGGQLDPGFNGRIFRKDDCEEGRTLCIGNGVTR